MKVLLIHNYYQSTHVGGEDLVFEQEKNALISSLGIDNVFTYTVSNDNLKKIKLFFSIWHNLVHAKKISQLIKKNNIDVVHVHNYFPILTSSIFKSAKKAGAKVVYTLHNYREWCLSGLFYRKNKPECYDCTNLKLAVQGIKQGCYRGSRFQSLLAALAYAYYKINNHLDYVDKFFILSETQQKILKKIQTPILSVSEIKPSFIPVIQQDKFLSQEIRTNYLYVGRLETIKGIDILLNAWQTLDPGFVLEIVGTGEIQAILQQKYRKNTNIIFLGKLPREQVLEKMAKAKYVIHPGIVEETQGLTLLEALGQGTPVIGFSIGTRKEYIQNGYNGFLCAPGNINTVIIQAERVFVEQPELYNQFCQQAIKSVQKFSPDEITKKQLEIYQGLLN